MGTNIFGFTEHENYWEVRPHHSCGLAITWVGFANQGLVIFSPILLIEKASEKAFRNQWGLTRKMDSMEGIKFLIKGYCPENDQQQEYANGDRSCNWLTEDYMKCICSWFKDSLMNHFHPYQCSNPFYPVCTFVRTPPTFLSFLWKNFLSYFL